MSSAFSRAAPSGRVALLVAGLCLASQGCRARSDASPSEEGPVALEEDPPALDREGRPLIPTSDLRVHGVALPRGLRRMHGRREQPVFTTTHPTERVVDFFAARLPEGHFDPVGRGGVFRGVDVGHGEEGRARVDVSILPISPGGTRVEVIALPTPEASDSRDREERLRDYREKLRLMD